ncbi:DLH domain-containing protein [Haematococcus lacustris]|uniref:DLH domain-containing protein n=1 Tax=Haematococcus lacustris TaxID=44745 RepID=A0A699ZGY5_HAELA|nr:DLH domain-containing protein [Haematococcus lacustris]
MYLIAAPDRGESEGGAAGRSGVLIPDLYKGKIGLDLEEARHMRAAAGFCMGGALSFAAAQKVPLIVAAAPNYGTPNPQQFQVEEIKIPILATFGGKDMVMGFSDPAVRPEAQNGTVATDGDVRVAWDRIITFFRTQLQIPA